MENQEGNNILELKTGRKALNISSLISVPEAAKILGVKISKIRKAIFKREISHIKLGALVRFREEDLRKYIEANLIPSTC